VLADSGHGYLAALPHLLAPGIALLAGALLATHLARGNGGAGARVHAWPFALLPPLVFAAQ